MRIISGGHFYFSPLRLVAFQEPLTQPGAQELKSVLSRRAAGFADSLTVLQLLPESDRELVSNSVGLKIKHLSTSIFSY